MINKLKGRLLALLILLCGLGLINGKAQVLPGEKYVKADRLQWRNIQDKLYNLTINGGWITDSNEYWYQLDSSEGQKLLICSKRGKISEPISLTRLADAISIVKETEIAPEDLSISALKRESSSSFRISTSKGNFVLTLPGYDLTLVEDEPPRTPNIATSPDGSIAMYSDKYNISMRQGDQTSLLTEDGSKEYQYGSYYGWADIIEGETRDRPDHFRGSWSSDGNYFLTQICDTRTASKMYMLDWSVDTLYRPRLLGYYRGSPGDTNVVKYKPVLFDIESKKEIVLNLPFSPHFVGYNFRWLERSNTLVGFIHERGYKTAHLLSINAQNGKIDTLFSETSPTNVDRQNFSLRIIESRNKVVLTSERDGWNQLYSIDLSTGKLDKLTTGKYFVNSIKSIDEGKGLIYYMGSGYLKGAAPYLQQLFSVSLEGGNPKLLTPEPLHHSVTLSADHSVFVDSYSSIGVPTVSSLRRSSDGKRITDLAKGDINFLNDLGWNSPVAEKVVLEDGTELWCTVWKPTDFDPSKSYPVIDFTYTGPHTHVYPTSFLSGIRNTSVPLAELGFIVVRINGRGSAGRSKKFHDYSYKRLGYMLGDHTTAIKLLSDKYAWMDASRVGIFGHSAGGYDAAHGLLQYPDFYKVGVSSSADHDHRMEKAWWPEMYMGWPVDTAYQNQSNITMASNLKGKLLITHGGIDDNVNSSASFKLAEALVKADKQFDMLIFPSQKHGYRGHVSDYFTLKRWNYFVEHLTEFDPFHEYKMIEKE